MLVYKITNTNTDKVYVGVFSRPDDKFATYWGSGTYLKRAIKKHGLGCFKKEILETCGDKDILFKREKYWVKRLNSKSPNGYNLTTGGQGLINASDKTRKRISQAKKGQPCCWKGKRFSDIHKKRIGDAQRGEKNHLYGKHLSDSHKKKISKKVRGKNHPLFGVSPSIETCRKISNSNMGKVISESARQKISMAMKNRIFTKKHRENLSVACSNPSPEWREKIRISKLGKKRPEWVCNKLKLAWVKRRLEHAKESF